MAAPVVDRVRTGTVTMSTAAKTVDLTSDPISSLTKAALFYSNISDALAPSSTHVAGRITDVNTLSFDINTADSDAVVRYYLVEWTSGVTVQRGSFTDQNIGGSEYQVALTVGTDLTASFISSHGFKYSGSSYGNDDTVRVRLVDNSGPKIGFLNDKDSTFWTTVYWEVVEYDDNTQIEVQHDVVSFSTGSSATKTITSVTLADSIITCSGSFSGTSELKPNKGGLYAKFNSATQVEVGTDTAPSNSYNCAFQVIEFKDNTSVQRNSKAFTATDTSLTQSITSVDTDYAIAFVGSSNGAGWGLAQTAYSTYDNYGPCRFNVQIDSATQITLERQIHGSATSDPEWIVIEFDAGGGATTHEATMSLGTDAGITVAENMVTVQNISLGVDNDLTPTNIATFLAEMGLGADAGLAFDATYITEGLITLGTDAGIDYVGGKDLQAMTTLAMTAAITFQSDITIEGDISLGVASDITLEAIGIFEPSLDMGMVAGLVNDVQADLQAQMDLGADAGIVAVGQWVTEAGFTIDIQAGLTPEGTITQTGQVTTPDGRVLAIEYENRTVVIEYETRAKPID